MRVVIDTNVFLESITSRSPYYFIFKNVSELKKFEVLVSNSMIEEYFELFEKTYSKEIVQALDLFFRYSRNIIFIDPHYQFNLIDKDPDDNKFVDCAICGNADWIITSDKDYAVLKDIAFPKVNVISPDEFIKKYS